MSAAFSFLPPVMEIAIVAIIGVGAAGLALLVGWRFLERVTTEASDETSADFALPGITSERRNAPRRRGNYVKAHLTDDSDMEPTDVWVVDRSIGGLCLLTQVPLEIGSQLRVRPSITSSTLPWASVRICSCRQDRDGWMVHCQFMHLPPMNVLLLFG